MENEQCSFRIVIPGGGDHVIGQVEIEKAKLDAQLMSKKYPNLQLWRTSKNNGGQLVNFNE